MKTIKYYFYLFICSYILISIPQQAVAVELRKMVPMASDTELKVELHLSVNVNEKLSISGIIRGEADNSVLWNGDLGTHFFKNATDTILVVHVSGLNPKLWSPVTPDLYTLDIKVDNVNSSKRIGFRKFEMINGQFYLNGRRIYLRGNAINPPNRGIPKDLEESKEFARDYVRFMKSININMIRIPDNQNWMDVCDEEGMMIFGGRYGRPKKGSPDAPPTDFDLSVETYKNEDLGPFTSHPSVMIYVMTNETPYNGKAGELYRDFLSRMHSVLQKWDNTKLYICNAGYGLGKSADIYDVHRYWGWYYNTFLTYLNMRDQSMWQNPGKVQPITFTECVGNYTGIDGRFNLCSRTKQPNSQKCWTGHLPDDQQAEAALTYQAFVLKNATEMFRRLRKQNDRLAGTMPFTIIFHHWDEIKSFADMGPKPVAKQYQISYQPILLSWENWQTQVYAGADVSVVAHVVNDDDYGNALNNATVNWKLEGNGKVALSGTFQLPSIPYYGTYEQQVKLKIPKDLLTGYYTLKGEIKVGNKVVSINDSDFFIAGNDWKQNALQKGKIYVYDNSSNETLNALKDLGFSVIKINKLEKISSKSVLIIGENSWGEELKDQTSLLKQYVEKGGRVICLKQDPSSFDLSWLPVKVEMLSSSNNSAEYLSPSFTYMDGMNVNIERPYHPVFQGLKPDMFRLWSDYNGFDESKTGFPSIYPVTQGYDLRGSDFGKIAILANYSRGLAATGLAELFSDKGSILLSGFDLTKRCGIDPVASRFLINMVNYMGTSKEHPVFVSVEDSIIWGDFVSEKGIVTGSYSGLMLNTTPIVPEDKKDKYPLTVDEYGYQFAGAYGGWNSKPGIQYVPNGRRAVAPFTFSRGGNTIIQRGAPEGEGFFYATIPSGKKVMNTTFENVVDKDLHISIIINDTQKEDFIIPAHKKKTVKSLLTGNKGQIKVSFKGDRRIVILKTQFE